ncbi:hypothetical protein ACLOJK_030174 [Asimina triloba]
MESLDRGGSWSRWTGERPRGREEEGERKRKTLGGGARRDRRRSRWTLDRGEAEREGGRGKEEGEEWGGRGEARSTGDEGNSGDGEAMRGRGDSSEGEARARGDAKISGNLKIKTLYIDGEYGFGFSRVRAHINLNPGNSGSGFHLVSLNPGFFGFGGPGSG